ncbi:hypothetical protein N183_28150 [Sinorhizobium sp. Sb3]|nr:hypothetical protein N183_28150 [Sinorhizobium sp. Sb3]
MGFSLRGHARLGLDLDSGPPDRQYQPEIKAKASDVICRRVFEDRFWLRKHTLSI